MYFVSERKDFWNDSEIAEKTLYGKFKKEKSLDGTQLEELPLKNRLVFLTISGFNNTAYQTASFGSKIKNLMQSHCLSNTTEFINVFWPGYIGKLNYWNAQSNIKAIKHRVATLIKVLYENKNHISIIAHSMGVKLICEALLDNDVPKECIAQLICFGPAITANSFAPNHQYFQAASKCSKIFIFFSENDFLLGLPFQLLERRKALGRYGMDSKEEIPKNCVQIDATAVIAGHNSYKKSREIFFFLRQALQPALYVHNSGYNHLVLDSNGRAFPKLNDYIKPHDSYLPIKSIARITLFVLLFLFNFSTLKCKPHQLAAEPFKART